MATNFYIYDLLLEQKTYNPGHHFLELYRSDSPQVKQILVSSITNSVYEFPLNCLTT